MSEETTETHIQYNAVKLCELWNIRQHHTEALKRQQPQRLDAEDVDAAIKTQEFLHSWIEVTRYGNCLHYKGRTYRVERWYPGVNIINISKEQAGRKHARLNSCHLNKLDFSAASLLVLIGLDISKDWRKWATQTLTKVSDRLAREFNLAGRIRRRPADGARLTCEYENSDLSINVVVTPRNRQSMNIDITVVSVRSAGESSQVFPLSGNRCEEPKRYSDVKDDKALYDIVVKNIPSIMTRKPKARKFRGKYARGEFTNSPTGHGSIIKIYSIKLVSIKDRIVLPLQTAPELGSMFMIKIKAYNWGCDEIEDITAVTDGEVIYNVINAAYSLVTSNTTLGLLVCFNSSNGNSYKFTQSDKALVNATIARHTHWQSL